MTKKGLHTISKANKLKLLPIPKAIKPKTKTPKINALFLFLNKCRNLWSLTESFFLFVPSEGGINLKTIYLNHLKNLFHSGIQIWKF